MRRRIYRSVCVCVYDGSGGGGICKLWCELFAGVFRVESKMASARMAVCFG